MTILHATRPTRRSGIPACTALAVLACRALLCAQADVSPGMPNDTIAVIAPDTTVTDSTRTAAPRDSMSSAQDTALAATDSLMRALRAAAAPVRAVKDTADTLYAFWSVSYWGIGAGWSLGSVPLFRDWQAGFPDSLGDFGVRPLVISAVAGQDSPAVLDTIKLRYQTMERPNAYSVTFPLHIRFYHVTNQYRFASYDIGGYFLYKLGQSTVSSDTLSNQVTIRQSLGFYALSLAANYNFVLPGDYFTVTGVNRTAVTAGIGAYPLVYARKREHAEAASRPDSLYESIERNANAVLRNFSAYGFGAAWRVGIFSLKKQGQRHGMEIGLLYEGDWFYFPDVQTADFQTIKRSDDADAVSFLSHRLTIRLSFVFGGKPGDREADDGAAQ